MSETMYFGGVEGGATHSNLVICDQTGKVCGQAKGAGTNHWVLGIDTCATRIIDMLREAKEDAGLAVDRPLDSLGLTLSGCEQDSTNAELAARVLEKDRYSSRAVYVASDTAGSLFTGAPDGGMVLIAGTGSNALLRTADGKQYGCGGWGYLLGDEGGAYWIAHKAVKTVFDDVDGLRPSPHPTAKVWEVVKEHFGAETRSDLLPHAYKDFDKSHFAGLTAKISQLASLGDPLSIHLFACAGASLGAHIAALCHRCPSKQVRVVCVGSVWHSWEVLREGMVRQLEHRKVSTDLELVRLRVSSALGAAGLAARHINRDIPRDDRAYCDVFYTYRASGSNGEVNGKENGHQCNGTVETNGKVNGEVDQLNGLQENGHNEGCGCTDWSDWS